MIHGNTNLFHYTQLEKLIVIILFRINISKNKVAQAIQASINISSWLSYFSALSAQIG